MGDICFGIADKISFVETKYKYTPKSSLVYYINSCHANNLAGCGRAGSYLKKVNNFNLAKKIYHKGCLIKKGKYSNQEKIAYGGNCFDLGNIYLIYGNKKNEELANKFFDLGCKKDYPLSCFLSGYLDITNYKIEKGMRKLNLGCKKKHIQSCKGLKIMMKVNRNLTSQKQMSENIKKFKINFTDWKKFFYKGGQYESPIGNNKNIPIDDWEDVPFLKKIPLRDN